MTTTHVSNEDIIVEHDAPWSRELGQPNGKDNHVVNGEDRGEALITELASLRDLAYQHRRTAAAIELKIGVGVLDKIVKQRRAELEDNNPTPLAEHWVVSPWPEPVGINELLQEITDRLARHVVMTPQQTTAVALWILFTWVHDAASAFWPDGRC